MTIHIDQNSDCAEEIYELLDLFKKKPGIYRCSSKSDVVSLAIDMLYDYINGDERYGNQG